MKQMRLLGMAQAFQISMESRQAEKFTPDEWMSYLIEAEWEDRQGLPRSSVRFNVI